MHSSLTTHIEKDGVVAGPQVVPIRRGRLGNWLPSEKHLEKRTRAFRGRMDELAIWNRALLASELRAMFEAGRQNVINLE